MRTRYKVILGLVIPLSVLLSNCGGGGGGSPESIIVPPFVTPQVISVAVNSATLFTASGTGANLYTNWSIANAGAPNVGSLSVVKGQSTTYTAPPTPPIYLNQVNTALQGMVQVNALVSGTGQAHVSFYVTTGTISAGISPATASVPLRSQLQFYAYAVGGTDNRLSFAVDGVVGGSAATGPITNLSGSAFGGLYTAPAAMPTTGNTVTITATSVADPTKSASAVVTLR